MSRFVLRGMALDRFGWTPFDRIQAKRSARLNNTAIDQIF
jgi:hypothetical protein